MPPNAPTHRPGAKGIRPHSETPPPGSVQSACSARTCSLEPLSHRGLNPIRTRKLVSKEMLGTNRRNFAIETGYGAYPSALWQLSRRAPDELYVGQSHIWREVNHGTILHHDKHSVAITHFDLVAHSPGIAE